MTQLAHPRPMNHALASAKRTPSSAIAIGLAVRNFRQVAGRTITSLVQPTGLALSVISRIENGSRKLDFAEAALLADELGITLQKLSDMARTLEESGAPKSTEKRRELARDLKTMQKTAMDFHSSSQS